MIIEMLVNIFFSLVDLILSIIPNFTIGSNLIGHLSSLGSFFGYLNTILDLNVAVACILFTVIVDNASFFMKIINFIIRKIPGIS